jgi:hypothetical protein
MLDSNKEGELRTIVEHVAVMQPPKPVEEAKTHIEL